MQFYIVNLKALKVQFFVSPCIVQVVEVDKGPTRDQHILEIRD